MAMYAEWAVLAASDYHFRLLEATSQNIRIAMHATGNSYYPRWYATDYNYSVVTRRCT